MLYGDRYMSDIDVIWRQIYDSYTRSDLVDLCYMETARYIFHFVSSLSLISVSFKIISLDKYISLD